MSNPVAEELRALRLSRGLTLSGAAMRGGTTAPTVSRWEGGSRIPRRAELARYLEALEACPRMKARLLSAVAPASIVHTGLEIGAPVGIGAVLRAMRGRQGMSQAELSRAVGVTQSTVAKWESGESTPTPETLHGLAFALRASAEEMAALSSAQGDGSSYADWNTPDDAVRGIEEIDDTPPALRDVLLLGLEAEAWRRAARDSQWDVALGCASAQRAEFDHRHGRPGLGGPAAARAVRIFRKTRLPASAIHALDVGSSLARRRGDDPTEMATLAGDWARRLPQESLRTWALSIRSTRLAALARRDAALGIVGEILARAGSDCTRHELAWGRAGLSAKAHLAAGDSRAALAALDLAPLEADEAILCAEVYHANDIAADDAWMDASRGELKLRDDWTSRQQLLALERRQKALQR